MVNRDHDTWANSEQILTHLIGATTGDDGSAGEETGAGVGRGEVWAEGIEDATVDAAPDDGAAGVDAGTGVGVDAVPDGAPAGVGDRASGDALNGVGTVGAVEVVSVKGDAAACWTAGAGIGVDD